MMNGVPPIVRQLQMSSPISLFRIEPKRCANGKLRTAAFLLV